MNFFPASFLPMSHDSIGGEWGTMHGSVKLHADVSPPDELLIVL